jgi:hypothetical protein
VVRCCAANPIRAKAPTDPTLRSGVGPRGLGQVTIRRGYGLSARRWPAFVVF